MSGISAIMITDKTCVIQGGNQAKSFYLGNTFNPSATTATNCASLTLGPGTWLVTGQITSVRPGNHLTSRPPSGSGAIREVIRAHTSRDRQTLLATQRVAASITQSRYRRTVQTLAVSDDRLSSASMMLLQLPMFMP